MIRTEVMLNYLEIPIYFVLIDRKVVIDVESMKEVFDRKVKELENE